MPSLSEINDRLFAQMERLAGENLKGEDLLDEVKRSEAMVCIADQMIDNSRLQLDAAKLFATHGQAVLPMLPQVSNMKAKE